MVEYFHLIFAKAVPQGETCDGHLWVNPSRPMSTVLGSRIADEKQRRTSRDAVLGRRARGWCSKRPLRASNTAWIGSFYILSPNTGGQHNEARSRTCTLHWRRIAVCHGSLCRTAGPCPATMTQASIPVIKGTCRAAANTQEDLPLSSTRALRRKESRAFRPVRVGGPSNRATALTPSVAAPTQRPTTRAGKHRS